jgi:hypothetical protein
MDTLKDARAVSPLFGTVPMTYPLHLASSDISSVRSLLWIFALGCESRHLLSAALISAAKLETLPIGWESEPLNTSTSFP